MNICIFCKLHSVINNKKCVKFAFKMFFGCCCCLDVGEGQCPFKCTRFFAFHSMFLCCIELWVNNNFFFSVYCVHILTALISTWESHEYLRKILLKNCNILKAQLWALKVWLFLNGQFRTFYWVERKFPQVSPSSSHLVSEWFIYFCISSFMFSLVCIKNLFQMYSFK